MKNNRIFISRDSNSDNIIATRYLPLVELKNSGEIHFITSEIAAEIVESLSLLKSEVLPGECWEYELIKREQVR